MSIRASVGAGGVNLSADVRLVQQLLNHQKPQAYTYGPIAVDGKVGPQTIGAITQYQSAVVRLSRPDGRVDPGGQTIQALVRNSGRRPGQAPQPAPGTPPPAGSFTLTVRHGGKVPSADGAAMFESTLTLAGPISGTFRGSIYPDDMHTYGWLKDGSYDLSLTLHLKTGTPTPADLAVRTGGDRRPALTVNWGNTVPVHSLSQSKTTAAGINVHNGFNSSRGSKGCVTLHPTEWTRFIGPFLEMFPNLSDWYEGNGSWRGRKLGSIIIQK